MGRSSSIHSSPVHTPGLHCAQARREGPSPTFPVVFLALLSLRTYDALPAPFPDNKNAVLNGVVQARWGPGQCAHLRPLPSSPGVGGCGELLVVTGGSKW